MVVFHIMKAIHLTSSGRKLGLTKICRDQPNCTILSVTRRYGYGKSVDAFILGSAANYDVKVGEDHSYVIDTGGGYRGSSMMTINAVLEVRDGEIIKQEGEVTGNAYTWVMK